VNTLSLAKPDKGRQAEAMLLQMAQTGQVIITYRILASLDY
jgi:DNA-binding TFAR19-related protein (PDSD5 family)